MGNNYVASNLIFSAKNIIKFMETMASSRFSSGTKKIMCHDSNPSYSTSGVLFSIQHNVASYAIHVYVENVAFVIYVTIL